MRKCSIAATLLLIMLIANSCEKKSESSLTGIPADEGSLAAKKNQIGYLYLDYYGACYDNNQIQIDILPDDPNNVITHKGGNSVAVAILSSDLIIWSQKWAGIYYTIYFQGGYVDLSSISLTLQTASGTVTIPANSGQNGLARHHVSDLNNDYRDDVIVYFPKSSFTGSGTATLTCRWSLEHSDCNALMVGTNTFTVQ